MSLFGALSSGVSGLTAQSSAMGAISDNITNISTVGYKNTKINFQTLVTKQTSATFYSAGGVQSKPRQANGVQGLLQASTSQTDLSIAGNGLFVVNEANQPGITNEYLYTRSGSFFMDNEGYLRNSSGFYLQAWPTDSGGTVIPANENLNIANKNIVSTDYLETVNLNRVGGTASATDTIGIGANLPSNDSAGAIHKTDVQFFDSLGNANTMSVIYTKAAVANEWEVRIEPPQSTSVLTIEDNTKPTAKVYASIGQLQFDILNTTGDNTRRPADGATIVIDGTTYEFRSAATTVTTPAGIINFIHDPTAADTIVDSTGAGLLAGYAPGDRITFSGTTNNNKTYTIDTTDNTTITLVAADQVITESPSAGFTTFSSVGPEVWVNTNNNTTISHDVADLVDTVKAFDPDFADFGDGPTTNNRIRISAGSSTTILFEDQGTAAITVVPTGLLDSSGVAVTTQTSTFTVEKPDLDYTATTQLKFSPGTLPVNADTIVINGLTYTFSTGEVADPTGADRTVFTSASANGDNLSTLLNDLEDAIEANDPNFAIDGLRIQTRSTGTGQNLKDTLVLTSLAGGDYTVDTSGITVPGARPVEPDGTSFTSTTITVKTEPGISFTSDGLPSAFNVAELEVADFANGAADMDDDPNNSKQITMDFGTVAQADGMTQFGAAYTPVFITQNGSRFGTFAGVTVNTSGLVTALFDNGETRPIFLIPLATFVNVNGLEGRTGNVWNATEGSGDYTLRIADNGPAGQTIQAALEASTVDIGEEFTNMIVVQRAYSAAAKIISTADQMLEELMRVKR